MVDNPCANHVRPEQTTKSETLSDKQFTHTYKHTLASTVNRQIRYYLSLITCAVPSMIAFQYLLVEA